MNDKKFNYEEIKQYVQGENGINANYKAYADNTGTANEQIATYINNGLTSAVNSPVVGRWFASTWEANTTYAENFQKNFNEWSQALYNAMTENKMTEEEIHEAMLPDLVYKGYTVDNSVYKGNNASLMIKTNVVYKAFDQACEDADGRPTTSIKVQLLLQTNPEAKDYLYDQTKEAVLRKYGIVGEDGKKVGIKPVPLSKVKNPIEREMVAYYNSHGTWPNANELSTLTVDGLRAYDSAGREEQRVEAMME